jgi:hypothetical protein
MKTTWNNAQGSRDRKAVAVLVCADGRIHNFTGETIPGVCQSSVTGYEKNGKWSNTTFEVLFHDTTVLVAWKEDWDTGMKWPQASWDAGFQWLLAKAPAATMVTFQEFIRAGKYPKTVERWDARDDAGFRRNWLRRLRRQIAALQSVPVGTLAQITSAADSRTARQATIDDLRRQIGIALGKLPAAILLPENKTLPGVLVNGFSAELARKHGASIDMRGHGAHLYSTHGTSYGVHSGGKTKWRNGKPVSYTHATHDNYVRSLAMIRAGDPRTVDYVLHQTEVAVTLPEWMTWGVDANGLRAVCGPDDYHPGAAELLAKNAASLIAKKLAENAETLKKYAAQAAADAAEMEGVYVCVADSRRAGNCLEGTLSFAGRHGLDPARHYHAPEILAQGNGDTARVRLAIRAAVNRHQLEMERGYADLADHRIS